MNGPVTSADRAALNSSIAFCCAAVSLSAGIGGIGSAVARSALWRDRSCASTGLGMAQTPENVAIAAVTMSNRMVLSSFLLGRGERLEQRLGLLERKARVGDALAIDRRP